MSTTATPNPANPTSWPDDAIAIAAARDVTRRHGSGDAAVDALRGVSVTLHHGEFVAVMGPSGSGKSTLMHIMAGLDTPTSGSVAIDGIALEGLKERRLTQLRRDRVGFVFQAYNLLPTLSAAENVALPLRLAGRNVDEDWIAELLDTVGLADRASHRPAELSGGQQQRIAVARALATRPAMIFADEPTGNLDSRASADVLALLRSAADDARPGDRDGHARRLAAATADRVVFLADGAVVADEPHLARGRDPRPHEGPDVNRLALRGIVVAQAPHHPHRARDRVRHRHGVRDARADLHGHPRLRELVHRGRPRLRRDRERQGSRCARPTATPPRPQSRPPSSARSARSPASPPSAARSRAPPRSSTATARRSASRARRSSASPSPTPGLMGLRLVSGRWPHAGEIAIDRFTASDAKFRIGDGIDVATSHPTERYRITGLVQLADVGTVRRDHRGVRHADGAGHPRPAGPGRHHPRARRGRRLAGRARAPGRGGPPAPRRSPLRVETAARPRRAHDARAARLHRHLPLHPARVRRSRPAGRLVHHLQHVRDHGRPARARARAPALPRCERRQALVSVLAEGLVDRRRRLAHRHGSRHRARARADRALQRRGPDDPGGADRAHAGDARCRA